SVASVLLLLAIWYVGDDGSTDGLRSWIFGAWRAAGIHGLIALTYAIWPKKAPEGEPARTDAEPARKDGSAVAARDPEHVPDLLVRRPGQDEEQVR
ncbi:hypothetical protein ACFU6J_36085, partial [Streptomyces gardneri]